jgi:maltose O-acetyltransferase
LFRLSGVKIGRRTFVNMDVRFMDDWQPGLITLEDEVSVAPYVSFVATSNPNESFIGREYKVAKTAPVLIREGAWLGMGAVVLPGVTVGRGAIIGANAVVTHDVEDFAIMVGVPAREIGDVREYASAE